MKCCNCKNLGKLEDEDGEPYDWCEKVCDCPDTKMERNCRHFEIATNADKIRAMSDEELAKQITEWNQGDCPTIGDCPETQNSFVCEPWKCWLDWLKQEVNDDP